jgi:hypothetical protein
VAVAGFGFAVAPIVALHRLLRLDQSALQRDAVAQVAAEGHDAALAGAPVVLHHAHRRIQQWQVVAVLPRVVHLAPAAGGVDGGLRLAQQRLDLLPAFDGDGLHPRTAKPLAARRALRARRVGS